MAQERKGPFRLVTVNTAPERAKKLIGRLVEALSDRYEIEHVANCSCTSSKSYYISGASLTSLSAIEEVAPTVREKQPNVLFSASMWSADEAVEIISFA
jgi:hypothetical protein